MRKVACLASKLAVALAATWCWAADLNAPAICIYDREQCFGIVQLRGGVYCPAGVYRRDREALASELNFGWPSAACTAPGLQAIHSPLTLG